MTIRNAGNNPKSRDHNATATNQGNGPKQTTEGPIKNSVQKKNR